MDDSSGEKTEQPTPRKLEQVREQGQTVKSTDLAETVCMLAVIGVLVGGERLLNDAMHQLIAIALAFVSSEHSMQGLLASLYQLFTMMAAMLVPVTLAAAIASAAGIAAQVGFVVSFEPVSPNFETVNPGTGLKRIFSLRSVLEVVKMVLKTALLTAVMWQAIKGMLPLLSGAAYQPLGPLAQVLWHTLNKLLAIALVAYLVLGVIDYKVQHQLFIRQNRMTKEEVKRENKEQEGDPHIKKERRKLGREIVNKGADSKNVSKANVVVTNPSHYAVAIRYLPSEYPLPVVIAKGVDSYAALIRRLAADAHVPIVANPPVARALYQVPTEEPIPEELFEVVAAILRWVQSIGGARISESYSQAH